MMALLILWAFDLAADSVSVPGWTYLALFLIAFVWGVILNTVTG